jgi:hypothetical protein
VNWELVSDGRVLRLVIAGELLFPKNTTVSALVLKVLLGYVKLSDIVDCTTLPLGATWAL